VPNKVVTQVPVVPAQIERLTVERQGLADPEPYLHATYRVVDTADQAIGHHRVAKIPLTAGQVSTLQTFVVSVVVPVINTIEGT